MHAKEIVERGPVDFGFLISGIADGWEKGGAKQKGAGGIGTTYTAYGNPGYEKGL